MPDRPQTIVFNNCSAAWVCFHDVASRPTTVGASIMALGNPPTQWVVRWHESAVPSTT